jgi:hypothetical protein
MRDKDGSEHHRRMMDDYLDDSMNYGVGSKKLFSYAEFEARAFTAFLLNEGLLAPVDQSELILCDKPVSLYEYRESLTTEKLLEMLNL